MDFLISRLFLQIRRDDMTSAKEILKLIKIDKILNFISKDCWYYGIQYQILLKSKDSLVLKLIGAKKKALLKYVKEDKFNVNEIESFLILMHECMIDTGVFISTSDIEDRKTINKLIKDTGMRLIIVDGTQLMANNLGMTKNIFKVKNLSFIEYLPY